MSWQNQGKSTHAKNRKRENHELYQQLRQKEKQEKEGRLRFLEVLSESISLPPDVLAGAPIVTMHGRNAVFIENHKKIAEYSEEQIVVQTGVCSVLVEGKRLRIDYFTKEEMKISGFVRQVSYQGG